MRSRARHWFASDEPRKSFEWLLVKLDEWESQGLPANATFIDAADGEACPIRPLGPYAPPGDWAVCRDCQVSMPRNMLGRFVAPLICDPCNEARHRPELRRYPFGIALNDARTDEHIQVQFGGGWSEAPGNPVADMEHAIAVIKRIGGGVRRR